MLMQIRRLVAVLVLTVAVSLGGVAAAPAHAAPPAKVSIYDSFALRAGSTGKGGIWTGGRSITPCGTSEYDKVKITSFATTISRNGKTVKRTSQEFTRIRVSPGTYRVHASLSYTYRGQTGTVTNSQTVKVRRVTDATSVSSAEYSRIKKGMTLRQVRNIVDGRGDYEYGYLYMDSTRFDHSVGVEFRHGRVVSKSRWANVYDWC